MPDRRNQEKVATARRFPTAETAAQKARLAEDAWNA